MVGPLLPPRPEVMVKNGVAQRRNLWAVRSQGLKQQRHPSSLSSLMRA